MKRRIVVEVSIAAPVELVWERTQDPRLHLAWDIRFTDIRYLDEVDERGLRLMDYRTNIGFGLEVVGTGRYLHSTPLLLSTFEFDSSDWKSLIGHGRGIWEYTPTPDGTLFKTVYDYDARGGAIGRLVDRILFRPLMRLATEWGFETLRLWCAGDEQACKRRKSRLRFGLFFVGRLLGKAPRSGAAASWIDCTAGIANGVGRQE